MNIEWHGYMAHSVDSAKSPFVSKVFLQFMRAANGQTKERSLYNIVERLST